MRAARFHGQHDIRIEDVPTPTPSAPDDVLVEVHWCGICGTDLHEYAVGPIVTPTTPHPLTGVTLPQTLGHEFSATVVEVGRRRARRRRSATGSRSCPPSSAGAAATAAAARATCAWSSPAPA